MAVSNFKVTKEIDGHGTTGRDLARTDLYDVVPSGQLSKVSEEASFFN